MYSGRPALDLPFLWALRAEVRDATGVILGMPEFEALRSRFGERSNPQACRFAYALMSMEGKVLQQLAHRVLQIEGASVYTFMYDGLVFHAPAAASEQLETGIKELEQATSLKVTW